MGDILISPAHGGSHTATGGAPALRITSSVVEVCCTFPHLVANVEMCDAVAHPACKPIHMPPTLVALYCLHDVTVDGEKPMPLRMANLLILHVPP